MMDEHFSTVFPDNKNAILGAGEMAQGFKNLYYSCKGPKFGSQLAQSSSKPSVTIVSVDLMSYSSLACI